MLFDYFKSSDSQSYNSEQQENKFKILLLISLCVDVTLLIVSIGALVKLCLKSRKIEWPSANAEKGLLSP